MTNSSIALRRGTAADVEACATICHEAFSQVNARHGFPPEIAQRETALGLMRMLLSNESIFGVVAESGGKVVGSNFIFPGTIGGIGPITIDPKVQEQGIGKMLMQRVIEHADEIRMPGVRLVQSAFNGRSMSLYTKLGFDVREPLICMNGKPIGAEVPGHTVRKAEETDIDRCVELCQRIHGHDRRGELPPAIAQKTALVVQRGGKITGYVTDLGFFGHAVAEQNSDLMALISAAPAIGGAGFLLPTRNGELFRWCLARGLRYVEPLTLMSRGLYNEPRGAFLPSILF